MAGGIAGVCLFTPFGEQVLLSALCLSLFVCLLPWRACLIVFVFVYSLWRAGFIVFVFVYSLWRAGSIVFVFDYSLWRAGFIVCIWQAGFIVQCFP